ncbi:hypothetical protein [Oscillibacter sp.]|uniref:hypothetical protein n=1 Tax=Oscillibacter sp. TaxID=1945593 RepID=UPI00339A3709
MKKTEQKTKLETRKHKAFRRTLVCLAVLVVFSVLHLYMFTPMQGIYYAETQNGTGRTHVVTRMLPPGELHLWGTLFYLTANENAVLMSDVQFHPLMGWFDTMGASLDCSEEAAIHAGRWSVGHEEVYVQYAFGRVDDPEIQSVAVSVEEVRYRTGEEVREELFRTEIEDARWFQKGDNRYFVIPVKDPRETNDDLERVTYSVVGLDTEGREIARSIDEWGAYTEVHMG